MTDPDPVILIPLDKIEGNPLQQRRVFTPEQMRDLTASVHTNGVLQPILVRPVDKPRQGITHQIVAGERRYKAAVANNLPAIPAVVREMDDEEAGFLTLVENLQREDPDDHATASAMLRMMAVSDNRGHPLSERALARKLDKSVSFVRGFLALLKLDPELQDLTRRRANVRASAQEIQRVKDPDVRRQLIEKVDAGSGHQEIKAAVQEHLLKERHRRQDEHGPDDETRLTHRQRERRQMEIDREVNTALREAESRLQHASTWLAEGVSPGFAQEELLPRLERVQRTLKRVRQALEEKRP